ncbi:bifunctional 3'-5' exonuclease/DNA polymerase [Salinibacterium sp. SYSU T00001]|uniref:bifunctional 3'-5' exonuclease/DNA polymerase n=1 Tax=Homoserinimonas sedimenticola TaxID=2986805 RepID=UPI0022363118|nr:bifunctional 3'-5' exonuclease/DNA polymerase [Salinibacterium sedimenticola]MCW4384548.1 bifunctional 3'-5' exonuclease/DNA polymerase [Salinibacterium sedimenticola]
MHIVVESSSSGVTLTTLDDTGAFVGESVVSESDFSAEVARREASRPRWVWSDTEHWYPRLLEAGVRVERCVDLRLCRAILRNSPLTQSTDVAAAPPDAWDEPPADAASPAVGATLFDLEPARPGDQLDPLREFLRQRAAAPPALALLLSAESAGALVAAEIKHTGLPWRAEVHDELLTRMLGPRPRVGERPGRMEALARDIRAALDAPELNPDSAGTLLRALQRAGLRVESTSKWELQRVEHPVITPLLEYKSLARLYSANGWHWLDTNVRDGRFHPDYVPGGVVTGRWASRGGGGALQLPKQVRGAVLADPGHVLVVADASQLEPRILAAMARDRAMVEAGAQGDLYAGIVASGAVATREQAKLAMLGAMYGATQGESGRLIPALARAYPGAIRLVEGAARVGERGERVSTLLGRGSPLPGEDWHELQSLASAEGASTALQERARAAARSWGRFTRNFVVQGTAAEWALCWMATLRQKLHALGGAPQLAFFLHDEVVVHTPSELADVTADAIREAAVEAGRLLFGELPIRFPLTVATVQSYADAK